MDKNKVKIQNRKLNFSKSGIMVNLNNKSNKKKKNLVKLKEYNYFFLLLV